MPHRNSSFRELCADCDRLGSGECERCKSPQCDAHSTAPSCCRRCELEYERFLQVRLAERGSQSPTGHLSFLLIVGSTSIGAAISMRFELFWFVFVSIVIGIFTNRAVSRRLDTSGFFERMEAKFKRHVRGEFMSRTDTPRLGRRQRGRHSSRPRLLTQNT